MSMILLLVAVVCVLISNIEAVKVPYSSPIIIRREYRDRKTKSSRLQQICAVLPGDPIITGSLAGGAALAVSIYSKVILARFALSWFPQLVTQFPILQPIFTVTEPYLKIFRSVIPPIGGFDISSLPAIFCLDILSQTAVAVGADYPEQLKPKKGILKKPLKLQITKSTNSRFKAFNSVK